jgi:hypothetical protein
MTGIARSQALIVLKSVGSGSSSTFSNPAGHVTLVKSAVVHNASGSSANAHVFVGSSAAAANVYLLIRQLAIDEVWTWTGFIALNEGDAVSVQLWAANMETWVSGAVLGGPNQFPIGPSLHDAFSGLNPLPATP